MQYRLIFVASMLAFGVSGCGQTADDRADNASTNGAAEMAGALGAGKKSKGELAFQQCAACHAIDDQGGVRSGPSLANILGQPAGRVDGYRYSEAMAASTVVWDRQTLSDFLADPRAVVPGNKMIFGGIRDEARRNDIIDYLGEISADGQ